MSFRDKLKKTQGTVTNYPKLDVFRRIDVKSVEQVKEVKDATSGEIHKITSRYPVFQFYDPAKKDEDCKGHVRITGKIEGIYIGDAMHLTCYSNSLKASYSSDYYVSRENVTIFNPKGKKEYSGTLSGAESWFASNTDGTPKKKKVLFVLTKSGLLAITTNMSIAIDQISANKKLLETNYISLLPSIYNPLSKTISVKCKKEYMENDLVRKNPPTHAEINIGKAFTDEEANEMNIEKYLDMYEDWKESKGGKKPVEMVEQEIEEPIGVSAPIDIPPDASFNDNQAVTDDLPF